jgi:hypothetical protein
MSTTPAGLTFAYWGHGYGTLDDNETQVLIAAWLVGPGYDPLAPPISDGFSIALEGDPAEAMGPDFDYQTTPASVDPVAAEVGDFLVYADETVNTATGTRDPAALIETYGWDPFDPANLPDGGVGHLYGSGGLDLSPGLHPSTYTPPGAPSFQDVTISATTLADGTLKQRFDTRAFPDLGDRLTGSLDGVQVPEPAVPLG